MLSYKFDIDPDFDLEGPLLASCRELLNVSAGKVLELRHSTARDFLLSRTNEAEMHATIARICLNYLTTKPLITT